MPLYPEIVFLIKRGDEVKKITVKDIAEKAGVSVSAVSFVINNKPGVSEETRKRVKRIIEESDFKPNQASRKLIMKKSFNICLMLNSFSSPFEDLFYFETTRGITNRSMKLGYNITIAKPVKKQSELPDMIYSGDADGIIFMQDTDEKLIEKANKSGVPFLVVDSHSIDPKITSVSPDYKKAVADATTYLIEHGHRDIAIITSETVPSFHTQTLDSFLETLEGAGIIPHPDFYNIRVSDEESAYIKAKELLSLKKRPTAVLCTTDNFAIGVMKCAKEMNIAIPDDVSVIGIDDIILSRYVEPNLTTMGIDKVGMGSLAMDMLIRKINGEAVESVLLPMELIKRDSVCKK